jgi:hypothetical protein
MKNPREGELAYEFCGKIFKYLILPGKSKPFGKSKRWAASGELESDSAIRFQTGPFDTRGEAAAEFMTRAQRIVKSIEKLEKQ